MVVMAREFERSVRAQDDALVEYAIFLNKHGHTLYCIYGV